jgi:serine/threonine-protein kinase
MGTPAYMSPEQCSAGTVDQRTDVYSLGCVLFHLVTGRPPFDHEAIGTIISAHLREPPPVPSHVSQHVPAILDPLIARCLAKRPDERFPTMLALQQACDAVLAQLPVVMPSGPDLIAPAQRADAVTTLGQSVGQVASALRPLGRGTWVALCAAAIAAGIGLAVTTRPSASVHEATPAVTAPMLAVPAPAVTITPLPDTGSAAAPPAAPAPPPAIAEPPAPPPKVVHPKPPAKKSKPARDLYDDRI